VGGYDEHLVFLTEINFPPPLEIPPFLMHNSYGYRDYEEGIMIHIIRAKERHYSENDWLKTHWLFSFDDYYDPQNMGWGDLRVFNDDIIAPHSGFPMHPHKEYEIVTVILDGEITHEDSAGHKGVTKAGEVQRMTAGTGVRHSEFNMGDKPLHLYQIWIRPDRKGHQPSYEQKSFKDIHTRNALIPVASGQAKDGAVSFNTDSTIYLAKIDAGEKLRHITDPSRKVFIYVTDGDIKLKNETLHPHDQGRIEDEEEIDINAVKDADIILIDVP
jgi:redox-sensitive bicupin YhaK (pirin superfamily)